MTTKQSSNSGCGIAVAVIGVIGSCIAIFTFLTGIVSIRDFVRQPQEPTIVFVRDTNPIDIPPTQVQAPYVSSQATSTAMLPSAPEPTLSIPTLAPTQIPPTSRPNLNLPMGDSYYGDGIRIALEEMHGELTFHLVVHNERTTPLIFSTYDTYAHLRDDVGNEYRLAPWNLRTDVRQYNVPPGSQDGVGNWDDLVFEGPISPKASYLIFEFEKLLGLENLTWKIPIG